MTCSPPPAKTSTGISLHARLLRAVVVIALLLVAVSALSTAAVTRLGGAIGLILRENYTSVVACQEMNEALEREDSAALFAATGRDDIARPMFAAHRAGFMKAFSREATNVTLPGEGERVREVDELYREYTRITDEVLSGPPDTRVEGYFKVLLPRGTALRARVTSIRLMNQKNMEWADREARRIARRALEMAILVTVLALVLAGWFVRRIPKTVLDPLESFTEHARSIGEGKLDATLEVPDVPELKVLGDALNRMQEKLRAYRESSLGELLAAKDLSRATIASMADPVIVFSARGEVLLANESAEAIFGLTSGDADELRQAGVEVPDPIAIARDAVLAHGEPILPQSLSDAMRWITKEGERYFLVRATPLESDDAGGAAAIVVAQDVTRYRRIDALKSDVVATVSHELKTPLTSLRLSTHMLLEESAGPLGELQRELAVTARDETERLQSTVDELLDLVRIEHDAGAPKRTEVDPGTLLREVISAHEKLASLKKITVDVAIDNPSPVELDPEQISIVLGNLLSNAIRHSREGAHVWLSGGGTSQERVFVVRDEGEGIPPEHLSRIFERHFSGADPATLKGRHGLGLAIAQEIAMLHGGTLEVQSTLGKGSTFSLRLPTRDHATEAPHYESREEA
ncbi:MAG TPA: ATP-binding protein [Polyangiaceae bacterium]|jgi:PAS domain S-box-containing protein